jgi:alpha-L-rhamnosidase
MRVFAIVLALTVSTSALAAPVHLCTNALESPLGIDTRQPLLSWQSDAKTVVGKFPAR